MKLLCGMMLVSTLALGAAYEGTGSYNGREIKIVADLNVPNYLTSENHKVEYVEDKVDEYHSDEVVYRCHTDIEFLGPTLLLKITDAQTGEVLYAVNEEEASLVVTHTVSSEKPFKCEEADLSKGPVEVRFASGAEYHIPVAKLDGHDVSLALYPLLSARVKTTLERQGGQYTFYTEQFDGHMPATLEIPLIHWGGVSNQVGKISLTRSDR